MTEARARYEPDIDHCGSFRLPLPPTVNHMYDPTARWVKGHRVHGKKWSDAYAAWRDEVTTILRGWEPPKRTPLKVCITLHIPKHTGRNADADGYDKPILDAVVGKHNDQWVDYRLVRRYATIEREGWADVLVRPLMARETEEG